MAKVPISHKLLEILVCPVCKRDVKLKGKELICMSCGRRYPVVNGIPYLLPPELMPRKYKKER